VNKSEQLNPCGSVRTGLLLLLLLIPLFSVAQTKVTPTPNCAINFALSGSSLATPAIDNRQAQCAYWSMGYVVNGFSAITIALQSSPDSAGAPSGVWSTYSGTAVVGSISSSTTPSAYVSISPTSTFNPWVRVALTATTGSGTVTGSAVGWTSDPGAASGGGSSTVTCASPGCVVVGPDGAGSAPTQSPVTIAGVDGDGNVFRPVSCTKSAVVSSSATSSVLIAGVALKKIRICRFSVTPASAINITLTQGTGTVCGTGTAGLSGEFQLVTALDLYDAWTPLIANTGQDVCMLLSSGVSTTGTVIYALY
jgi:hypothetical protein